MRQFPASAISQKKADVLLGFRGHDHPHFLDAGIHQVLKNITQDRFVGHRNQLLGHGMGDGTQTGPFAAGEH